jgi:hypothetical protein
MMKAQRPLPTRACAQCIFSAALCTTHPPSVRSQHVYARPAVDLEGQPFGALAASFAALQLLLGTLGTTPSLAHISLSLSHRGLGAMPAYQLSQLQRAWGSHVVRGLARLLELNPAIRCEGLIAPVGWE